MKAHRGSAMQGLHVNVTAHFSSCTDVHYIIYVGCVYITSAKFLFSL